MDKTVACDHIFRTKYYAHMFALEVLRVFIKNNNQSLPLTTL